MGRLTFVLMRRIHGVLILSRPEGRRCPSEADDVALSQGMEETRKGFDLEDLGS